MVPLGFDSEPILLVQTFTLVGIALKGVLNSFKATYGEWASFSNKSLTDCGALTKGPAGSLKKLTFFYSVLATLVALFRVLIYP
jgi:hypothetical protein